MAGTVIFADALEIVCTHASTLAPPPPELVDLTAAQARTLAEQVTADRDQPPFHRSTRDGFAVRADEWSSGQTLHVVGQLRAGELWQAGPLAQASAIEIMTGAPLPEGADSVAMLEHAQSVDGQVRALAGRKLSPGENVVPRAAEAHAGDVILHPGTDLGPAEIAVAATCGRTHLQVYGRPRVAIVATGDELVDLAAAPAPHQIRNSNSYSIAALVRAAGGCPDILPIARDRRDDIHERIANGRTRDLLVLSGGVSAGKFDLVEEVLATFGAEFLFTGVTMQPGKPVVFGRLPPTHERERECYFFGLPGNPVSTQVTFHCFVEPFLRVLGGAAWSGPRFAQATLAQDVPAKPSLTRLLPARLTPGLSATHVHLVPWQGSGDLAANARANCYAVLPENHPGRTGDVITILLR